MILTFLCHVSYHSVCARRAEGRRPKLHGWRFGRIDDGNETLILT